MRNKRVHLHPKKKKKMKRKTTVKESDNILTARLLESQIGLLFAVLEGKRYSLSSLSPKKRPLWPGSMPRSIPECSNLSKLL